MTAYFNNTNNKYALICFTTHSGNHLGTTSKVGFGEAYIQSFPHHLGNLCQGK